jgi:spermidine dehydrogenase
MLHPLPEDEGGSDQMFPGGNTTIARLMLKSLIPDAIPGPASVEGVTRNTVSFPRLDVASAASRIRLSSTVIYVQHDGDPTKAHSVTLVYVKGGQLYRVKARSVVMAGGSWTTKHIVKDLPQDHRTLARLRRSLLKPRRRVGRIR